MGPILAEPGGSIRQGPLLFGQRPVEDILPEAMLTPWGTFLVSHGFSERGFARAHARS